MDPSESSTDWQWLHERVRRDGETAHPVVYSAFRPATEGGDPWTTSAGLAELDRVRDYLQSLEERPRVLVVTDIEEDPTARVFAAVVLARSLAEAGEKCVLVDADLRHVGLARHLPADLDEAEGLVDVVQYGASVPASLRPTPVDGVKVLSAGSWRPDGSEVFADADLRRLISQLRATGHTVLLLTPAWLPDERFHPLLVHGDVVLVSLHLDRAHAPFLEELLDYLRGLGVPVGGVVAYAGRASIDLAVDDALHESEARPIAAPPVLEDPVPAEVPTAGESVVAARRRPPDAPEFEAASESGPEPPQEASEREPERPRAVPGATLGGGDEIESSSPVFVWTLGVFAVLVVAFGGWFFWTQRQGDDEGARLARAIEEARPPASRPAPETASPARDETDLALRPEADVLDDSLANLAASRDLARESSSDDAGDPQTARGSTTPDRPTATPEVAEDSVPAEAEVSEASRLDALELALRRPAGGGYALYPWSFPDSLEALTAAEKLLREGMMPGVRGAYIESKDARWYRVVVGRFDTRAQAMQARELLSSRRDVDWVGVVRVP